MFAIQFGNLTIDDIADWEDESRSRLSTQNFPRRHGSIIQKYAFLEPRRIRVNGEVSKASEAALTSYLDTLAWTLTSVGRNKLFLRDNLRYLNAIKSGFAHGYRADRGPALQARFSIEFLADDPFWYGTTEKSNTQTNISSSPHVWSVTNAGLADTPALIQITALDGNKTDMRINNTTVDLFSRYTGTLGIGNTLILDGVNFRVLVGSSIGLKDFTGSFWLLEPGINNLTYTGPTGVTVKTSWFERWL